MGENFSAVWAGGGGDGTDLFWQRWLKPRAGRPFSLLNLLPQLQPLKRGVGWGRGGAEGLKGLKTSWCLAKFQDLGRPWATHFHTTFLCEYHRGSRLCTSPRTGFFPSLLYICKRRLIKRLKKSSLLVNLLETKPSTCDASKLPRATSLPQKSQLGAADEKIKSLVHKNFPRIVV